MFYFVASPDCDFWKITEKEFEAIMRNERTIGIDDCIINPVSGEIHYPDGPYDMGEWTDNDKIVWTTVRAEDYQGD